MKTQKNIHKKIIFIILILFIFHIIVELFSYFSLSLFFKKNVEKEFLEKFPIHFRLSKNKRKKFFPKVTPIQKTGQFLGFEFEPLLGFKDLSALEWHGKTNDNDLKNKFIILTFGGSTTVKDNWPKYLIEIAKEKKVKNEIVILNAGLWGYHSFNESLYFVNWILPLLEDKGIKPNIVLSLNGVNDIWYRILSYFEYKRSNNDIWYYMYHGYHQQHTTDMQNINTFKGAFKQILSVSIKYLYSFSVDFFPYTIKNLEMLLKTKIQSKPMIIQAEKIDKLRLDEAVEKKIIEGFKSGLINFYAFAEARNIKYISYLQPVVLKEYYPHNIEGKFLHNGIDYMGLSLKRTNRAFTRLYSETPINTQFLYKNAEKMYAELNSKYKDSFTNLISVFKDIDKPEDLFDVDAIHYNLLGKKIIAERIIEDLISKNILEINNEK